MKRVVITLVICVGCLTLSVLAYMIATVKPEHNNEPTLSPKTEVNPIASQAELFKHVHISKKNLSCK